MLSAIDRFIILGLSVAGFVAVVIALKAGLPDRLTREVDLSPNYGLHSSCDRSFNKNCIKNSTGTLRVAVVGDSLAMSISSGLLLATKAAEVMQITQSSCTPLVSATTGKCKWLDSAIKRETAESDRIFIASTFSQMRKAKSRRAFSSEILKLSKDQAVTVVIPAPYFKETARCLKRTILLSWRDECTFDVSTATNNDIRASLKNMVVTHSLDAIDLADLFCSSGKCSPLINGNPILRDNLHFSVDAVDTLNKFFEDRVQ